MKTSNLEVARALESHGHLNMATAAMSTAGGFLTAVTNSAMTARDNNNERASAERQTQNVIQGQLALEKMAHSNQKEREAQRAAEMALLREVELADVKKDEKLSLYELKLREMVMRDQLKKQRMGGNQQGATTGMADEEAMPGDMGQDDGMDADDEMDDEIALYRSFDAYDFDGDAGFRQYLERADGVAQDGAASLQARLDYFAGWVGRQDAEQAVLTVS
ncbi:hypothetical protein SYNPS1DRAFT_24792 [Syncephalis pseudoplumigaleata]|uniref:Uncharacterized protein n=1 Tax=Syncephalis pseudoplumigaleata TaxID=1712513 RepID=A0A4P9YTT0_9FUNG|nr:hypothetical protein SYNPS1DRAFT_24792 [Syncephalis pseudoplumigaleata]|eukprot:RKP23214.1 hypothetical protein SYNPS1DRAFT_24792 [Syncephalis pseudoplumigaleata]